MMADVKTKRNDNDVQAFLEGVEHPQRKADSLMLYPFFKKITGMEPKMWGGSIVGYGSYHYKYESGREGDWPLTGFSPRKQSMTIYIMSGFNDYQELLKQLGKHKTSKSCLYINKLSDVSLDVLEKIIYKSFTRMNTKYNDS